MVMTDCDFVDENVVTMEDQLQALLNDHGCYTPSDPGEWKDKVNSNKTIKAEVSIVICLLINFTLLCMCNSAKAGLKPGCEKRTARHNFCMYVLASSFRSRTQY